MERVGNKMIHSICGRTIPFPQSAGHRLQSRGADPQPIGISEVVRLHVPDETHRREAVTDVQSSRWFPNGLRSGVADAYDQIVVLEIQSGRSPGEERKQITVVTRRSRNPIQLRRVYRHGLDTRADGSL